ncbi:uncharacterized protein LOC105628780 isoform X2 [Jatropha curcas]|uniref:uncharacterized protein LOC105628780 isoform X2 n=1 Tax=Jatropha curcas TaxID=180498 RepID=UPI0005FB029F|nr:uncharacterized protein LOC105628780 isoform X2 [Jatropha curcas]
MDRSEPALVPEWLKSGGNVPNGGNPSHFSASASLPFDYHPVSKHSQNKSSLSGIDHDTRRLSILERTTSAYFRQGSSSNGSVHLRSTSSLGRSHRDRDWEDVSGYCDKEKLVSDDNRHHEHLDPSGNIFPSKLDKDKLRLSQSIITGKQDDTWSKKVAGDLINPQKNKHSNSNGSGILARVGVGAVNDTAFEQDFPSLGAEERQVGIGRVPSPGLSTAIQTGTSAIGGSENWKSALAEVPVVMGNSNLGLVSAQQAVPATTATVVPNVTMGLKMAEALAQGPPRARTPPQSTAGIQRSEELAIRQSKLIPMTPSTPKTLVVSPSEKTKSKIGSVQFGNHSRGAARSDAAKVSNESRLQVLKPSRELNGISSAVKDISNPNGSKGQNNSLGIAPLAIGSVPLRSSGNSPNHASAECHSFAFRRPTMEKRPTLQVQSRNDFFNHLKKKSSIHSTSVASESSPILSSSISEMSGESAKVVTAPVSDQGGDSSSSVASLSCDDSGKMVYNGDTCSGPLQFDKGEKDSCSDVIPNPDEEEAAFLRSLGWDENAGEDEGLTEEEIRAFYEEYTKLRPSLKLHGNRPAMTLDSHNSTCSFASSALSSSDTDSDS